MHSKMQFVLKALTPEAISAALERADKYRLLNEPAQAESICLDVLQTEPGNQQATIMLLLSLADQFAEHIGTNLTRAQALLPRIGDEYQRTYYAGILYERQARSHLNRAMPGSGFLAFDFFQQAMR
ncbi:MAG: hypothetical protein L0Z53_14420, partial [Acidobacteriales bacterium]|nr:hypothetical protein [Terriglobales bacterium]